jgi:two-component system, chemotaxis family, sensor kinase CheA
MDMSRYRALFFSEAREHLTSMARLLIDLEKNPEDRTAVDALFREAHSIKGMAASMGFERTAELSHALEDLLDNLRRTGRVESSCVDTLLAGVDLLAQLLTDLEAERPERDTAEFLATLGAAPVPEQPTPQAQPAAPVPSLVQITLTLVPDTPVPAARLFLIYKRIAAWGRIVASTPDGEALQQGRGRSSLSVQMESEQTPQALHQELCRFGEIADVRVEPYVAVRERAPVRREDKARTVRVNTELLDRFINLAGEMITSRHQLQLAQRSSDWQQLRGGIDGMARLVTDLHHHVLKVRMMPLSTITANLPRLVRDVSRKNGKDIAFDMRGEEIELDRTILEELAEPLMHMLRNAIDHGIDKIGRIHLRAGREKDMAVIEVGDDGRGMDPEALRQKAQAKGLLTAAQAAQLPDREALYLICRPGFSTAAAVTSTSGRGVGMDVVKNAVEGLGGNLEIYSRAGQGTRFILRVPLSVAIIQVLMVECGGCRLGIPLTRVLRLLNLAPDQVRSSGKKLVVPFEGELLPLLSLRKILGRAQQPLQGTLSVVVTEVRGRRVGLVVDALAGQRETFVKTLEFPLNQVAGISGASVLGDGRILFVVDPQQLLEDRRTSSRPTRGVPS